MVNFIERHAEKIAGVLSCLDRVVITGTLPDICHAEAATRYLFNHKIRIFDYTKLAEPLRDQIRSHAEKLASDHGLTIEFLRNHDVRKEDRIQEILAHRGRHPGLVHIFSAMEPCPSFQPWHDKATGKTFLKYRDGKCLHYYSWRSPVGAPVTRSSDLPHRLWQLSLGEFAILTPRIQFPIAPRRFHRGQGQHSSGRPTHPLVLATS